MEGNAYLILISLEQWREAFSFCNSESKVIDNILCWPSFAFLPLASSAGGWWRRHNKVCPCGLWPNCLNFWRLHSQKGNTLKYCKLFYTESTKEALYGYRAMGFSENFLIASLGFVKGRGKVSDENERKTCSQLGPLSLWVPFTRVQMADDFFPWSRTILDYLWGMQAYRKLTT